MSFKSIQKLFNLKICIFFWGVEDINSTAMIKQAIRLSQPKNFYRSQNPTLHQPFSILPIANLNTMELSKCDIPCNVELVKSLNFQR